MIPGWINIAVIHADEAVHMISFHQKINCRNNPQRRIYPDNTFAIPAVKGIPDVIHAESVKHKKQAVA